MTSFSANRLLPDRRAAKHQGRPGILGWNCPVGRRCGWHRSSRHPPDGLIGLEPAGLLACGSLPGFPPSRMEQLRPVARCENRPRRLQLRGQPRICATVSGIDAHRIPVSSPSGQGPTGTPVRSLVITGNCQNRQGANPTPDDTGTTRFFSQNPPIPHCKGFRCLLYAPFTTHTSWSPVAQLVEQAAVNRSVVGSSPTRGANLKFSRPAHIRHNLSPRHG